MTEPTLSKGLMLALVLTPLVVSCVVLLLL